MYKKTNNKGRHLYRRASQPCQQPLPTIMASKYRPAVWQITKLLIDGDTDGLWFESQALIIHKILFSLQKSEMLIVA